MKYNAKVNSEIEKVREMDGDRKRKYFRDYYLLPVLLILVLIFFLVWFIRDAVTAGKVVYSGATVGFDVTEDGQTFMTEGFIQSLDKKYAKRTATLSSDVLSSIEKDSKYDGMSLEMAFTSQVSVGMLQYLIMPLDTLEYLSGYDFYMDLSDYAANPKYADLEYYVDEEQHLYAIKIDPEVCQKISYDQDELYLVFVHEKKPNALNEKMIDYLCLNEGGAL